MNLDKVFIIAICFLSKARIVIYTWCERLYEKLTPVNFGGLRMVQNYCNYLILYNKLQ